MSRAAIRWLILAPVLLAVVAGVVLLGGWLYLSNQFDRPGGLAEEHTLVLEHGSSAWAIAQTLEEAGVIDDRYVFALGVWFENRAQELRAGEYAFEPAISPRGAMEKLVAGDIVVHRVTVPEGLSSAQIVALINEAAALDGTIEETPSEGTLLPETYHYHWGDTRESLLTRMRAAMDEALSRLWPNRMDGLPFEEPGEAVILASIVEKETAVPAERPLVAGVFVNRLRKDMPLQSDPTVIYALTQGRVTMNQPLTRADLRTESPYNTYRQAGLPPGPIANPGRASLAAVLQPAKTDALYFVADGSGGHVFAETLDEHNRNVARWRRLRKEGGANAEER